MAEENKSGNTAFEDLMLALFAVLIVGQIFQQGPSFLTEHWGVEFGGQEYLMAGVGLSENTTVGTEVNTPNGAPYYEEMGDEEPKGVFAPGTALTVTDGPENGEEGRWWEVGTIAGEQGWVREEKLVREGVGGIGQGTRSGDRARALFAVDLWNAAGGEIKTGKLEMGDQGELIKGPRTAHGSRWWFFDSDDSDEDGWVTQAALALASETGWQEGERVKGNRTVDIYEHAGRGQVVGLLKEDEEATILTGPVEVGGVMWWFIETEDGEEGWVAERDLTQSGFFGKVKFAIIVVMVVGVAITLVLLVGIIYITIRTNQIRAQEKKKINEAIPKQVESMRNERWEKIVEHVSSENPSDWRLAIIEADVLLDELLTSMGYLGDTLGEKLKQVVRGDMETLESAWEAHKVRNKIAHAGSDYILTKREAQRVIDLYAAVFNETKMI